MSDLYRIMQWATSNGEVKAVSRIRMKMLPISVKEHVNLGAVDASTQCSPEFLAAFRKTASDIVGKNCPY